MGGARSALLQEPEALCAAYEKRAAAERGKAGRKAAGLFYTPPEIAARVVRLALEHGPSLPASPRVLDACAGAGVFLLAAARALPGARLYGTDLDPQALKVAGEALGLLDAKAVLEPLDVLRSDPASGLADLLVGNPPYGHAAPEDRAWLVERFPGLRGAEVDLYAAFLLRSLELVRPGGCVALLVPDTWMTNARGAPLRAAILAAAGLCAVADLGKPFGAAKDTRVQAVVMTRRTAAEASAEEGSRRHSQPPEPARARPIFTARLVRGELQRLAALDESELRAREGAGWQPYRTPGEKRLCAALEAASVPLAQLCTVGYGLRTGDNGRHVARTEAPGGLVALCGGEDVLPFALRWHKKHLAAPTPDLLRLAARQLGTPRVAVQRIRTNAGAPWARWLEAAPVPPQVACLDSLSTLSAPGKADPDLLWALLGLCASVAWNRWHRLRTTDVNVKPAALRELPAPRGLASAAERATLAALSRRRAAEVAAELAAGPLPARSRARSAALAAPATERAIDRAVYQLFGLADAEVEEAERGFWGPRFVEEHSRLPAASSLEKSPFAAGPHEAMSDPFARVAASWEG
jgi:N-6 DNA Methylase